MPKRYLSDLEYKEQQFRYIHDLVDPQLMASIIDKELHEELAEDEVIRQKRQDMTDRLIKLVKNKIEKELTKRQKDAIHLDMMSKKQEYMGIILGISQEAASTRLKLGYKKLKEKCFKDEEIIQLLIELRNM
jgi:hypothetical protein